MQLWNQHFTTRRIASSFLLLSLVAVAGVGGVAYVRAREALKQAAFDRLSVTATLKESEIDRWFESCEQDFLWMTQFPDVQINLKNLLKQKPGDASYQSAYSTLSNYLKNVAAIKPKFREIFVLDRSNRIILSTDKRREGEYEVGTNFTYFETVEPGETFTPVFYRSPATGKPAVTFAAPLRNAAGVRHGVILADLNLTPIDQVVRQRTGLGKTGETYIVGSLAHRNSFISRELLTQIFPEEPHSEGIDAAMQGMSGAGLYRNYANIPVIGMFRWLNGQDVALLVEMNQAEAFAPARQVAGTIILVGLTSAGVLLLGVNQLARQLKHSREQLENYSRQLEQKAREAETANRAKSEFLANMSHELRTPLNAILGFTQIMARDASASPSQLERLSVISRSGEHLLALINDVLSMAKIEAGRTTLNITSFDLYHLLTSLEEMLSIKTKSKGLALAFEWAETVPQWVQTDEGKLRQVLLNLLGNAIKFTEQGQIRLQVGSEEGRGDGEMGSEAFLDTRDKSLSVPRNASWGDRESTLLINLWFEVSDTGPGIAATELNSLFDPFFQAARIQQSHQGTGLGLAISRQFVNLLGGDIAVSSTLGQGATFTFNIQARLAEATEQPQPPDRQVVGLEPHQPPYRILVVEDSLENRQLLVELLVSAGFEVQGAENGRQGVHLWSTWNPHLIWMDMRMPVMDGYEAVRRIRAQEAAMRNTDAVSAEGIGRSASATTSRSPIAAPSGEPPAASKVQHSSLPPHRPTKIIALTASAFDEDRATVLAVGCDDFVRKPFQEAEIFDKMADYLGVRYVYQESSPAPHLSAPAPSSFVPGEELGAMPPEWIAQLREAAIQVDAVRIHELLAAIPSTQTALAQHLLELTQQYDFDAIIDLTQEPVDV